MEDFIGQRFKDCNSKIFNYDLNTIAKVIHNLRIWNIKHLIEYKLGMKNFVSTVHN